METNGLKYKNIERFNGEFMLFKLTCKYGSNRFDSSYNNTDSKENKENIGICLSIPREHRASII